MAAATKHSSGAGYKRLWIHSYRLGFDWLRRTAKRGFNPGRKAGFQRLLVPLDPWRYYEMGVIADETFTGRCLDVSGPKLLTSLLHREGSGDWLGIDLFEQEIEAWRAIDPGLELEVQDGTDLPYADESFDFAICISVVEHMGRGNDTKALQEIYRVLKPGGTLHLTSMVSASGRDVYVGERIYGNASEAVDQDRVFFEHIYSPAEFDEMIQDAGWTTAAKEFALQTKPQIQQRFYRWAPFSYLLGPWLRLWFPRTISVGPDSAGVEELGDDESAVVRVKLRKPERRPDA